MYKFIAKRFSNIPKKIITQLFINGKFVNSVSGKTFKTINPATEEVLAEVQEAGVKDVELAIESARKAFDEGPWRKISGYERGRLLNRLADLIERDADDLALLESLDNGKPRHVARGLDLEFALSALRYYAGWADKIHGKVLPHSAGYFAYTRHEPIGVCGQIIPWNVPLIMVAWKLAPCLATGNTTVVKSAELTPLTAFRVAELVAEAGFPDGVVNIITGEGEIAGKTLAQSNLVDKIAFTGSTEVGYEIMRNSHVNNLKRITLELGGKSALIICEDADVDEAVQISQEAYFNMGQVCFAATRVFVHERIYDEFVEKSSLAARNRKVDDPLSGLSDQGPLISKNQQNTYNKYINLGKQEGAKLNAGGNILERKGYFVEPTVFSEVNDDMTISKEEIFGPVICVLKYRDIDDAIRRANNSKYGLGGGVVSKDIKNVLKVTSELRTGTVFVNCYNPLTSSAPFGGFKDSGIGREQGEYGLNNYTEVKTVVIKN